MPLCTLIIQGRRWLVEMVYRPNLPIAKAVQLSLIDPLTDGIFRLITPLNHFRLRWTAWPAWGFSKIRGIIFGLPVANDPL
jgi:hypothetical protein